MSVHVRAAGLIEHAQTVQAGHVEHQAHVVDVQDGAQELAGGVLQRLQAVAVSQTQEVQQHLFPGRTEAGPARVQVVQQHGECFSPGLLQTNLSLGLGLLHPTVQQGPEADTEVRVITIFNQRGVTDKCRFGLQMATDSQGN